VSYHIAAQRDNVKLKINYSVWTNVHAKMAPG
jgi:hypothetical protein